MFCSFKSTSQSHTSTNPDIKINNLNENLPMTRNGVIITG